MKLKAKVKGPKVHEVGYKTLLMTEVLGPGIQRFSAQNRKENGEQVVIVLVEGDEKQVAEFRDFMENNSPERALVSSVTFEDFEGHVMSVYEYSQLNMNEQLNKGIPALLRLDEKQDKMLEKQDKMLEKQDTTITILKGVKEDTSSIKDLQVQMLDKQDKMLDKQDTTIGILKDVKEDTSSISNGISELKRDAMDSILEKYFELSREIAEIKATLSEIKAKVSRSSAFANAYLLPLVATVIHYSTFLRLSVHHSFMEK